jgi:hypothetical protein
MAAFKGIDNTINTAAVSPMTTLVVHEMLTGFSTFEMAQRNVASSLGFTNGTNLMQDFVLTNNTSMHTMAQRLAFAFGEATHQALKDASFNPQEAFLPPCNMCSTTRVLLRDQTSAW